MENWSTTEDDSRMQNSHLTEWSAIIDAITEKNLQNKKILDFGCNQGGFLRFLYSKHPFKSGLGVDIAKKAISIALEKKADLALDFKTCSDISKLDDNFDIVFSHDVVYLLSDLSDHAKKIYKRLNPQGVYYLSLTSHKENPLWKVWKEKLKEKIEMPTYWYTIDEIAGAFEKNNFSVSAQWINYKGFTSYSDDKVTGYFPNLKSMLDQNEKVHILFRLTKKEMKNEH